HLMPTRRFPAPWSVEEQTACFVVRDNSGQALAYCISRMSRGADRRQNYWSGTKRDGLRRILQSCQAFSRGHPASAIREKVGRGGSAANIARLAGLLSGRQT